MGITDDEVGDDECRACLSRLKVPTCSEEINKMAAQKITGKRLLKMSAAELDKNLNLEMGPKFDVIAHITNLKAAAAA